MGQSREQQQEALRTLVETISRKDNIKKLFYDTIHTDVVDKIRTWEPDEVEKVTGIFQLMDKIIKNPLEKNNVANLQEALNKLTTSKESLANLTIQMMKATMQAAAKDSLMKLDEQRKSLPVDSPARIACGSVVNYAPDVLKSLNKDQKTTFTAFQELAITIDLVKKSTAPTVLSPTSEAGKAERVTKQKAIQELEKNAAQYKGKPASFRKFVSAVAAAFKSTSKQPTLGKHHTLFNHGNFSKAVRQAVNEVAPSNQTKPVASVQSTINHLLRRR